MIIQTRLVVVVAIERCSLECRNLIAFALVFSSSFDWFTGLSVFFVIGQCDYFGFGFTILNRKLL